MGFGSCFDAIIGFPSHAKTGASMLFAILAAVLLFAGRGASLVPFGEWDGRDGCLNLQTPYAILICQAEFFIYQSREPETTFQEILCAVDGMVYTGEMAWCKVRPT
jgi:hypothetical protein